MHLFQTWNLKNDQWVVSWMFDYCNQPGTHCWLYWLLLSWLSCSNLELLNWNNNLAITDELDTEGSSGTVHCCICWPLVDSIVTCSPSVLSWEENENPNIRDGYDKHTNCRLKLHCWLEISGRDCEGCQPANAPALLCSCTTTWLFKYTLPQHSHIQLDILSFSRRKHLESYKS